MSDCFETHQTPLSARKVPDAGADQIFAFEQDFAGSLRCIPMIVRFKLDRVGVKLSLRQWSQFDCATRGALVSTLCEGAEDVVNYRAVVIGAIEGQADEPPKLFAVEAEPAWADGSRTALAVTAWSTNIGVAPPADTQWCALSDLQRFALLKLTRAGHDNDNFYPALVEFGLVAGEHIDVEP